MSEGTQPTPEQMFNRAVQTDTEELVSKCLEWYGIGGKTFDQWDEYFTISLDDVHSHVEVMEKLKVVSNKIDECHYFFTRAETASLIKDYDIFVYGEHAVGRSMQKTITAKEREAKAHTMGMLAVQKQVTIFETFWKKQIDRLYRKHNTLTAMLTGYQSEMKHLGGKFF
jgi:hypothetical protein